MAIPPMDDRSSRALTDFSKAASARLKGSSASSSEEVSRAAKAAASLLASLSVLEVKTLVHQMAKVRSMFRAGTLLVVTHGLLSHFRLPSVPSLVPCVHRGLILPHADRPPRVCSSPLIVAALVASRNRNSRTNTYSMVGSSTEPYASSCGYPPCRGIIRCAIMPGIRIAPVLTLMRKSGALADGYARLGRGRSPLATEEGTWSIWEVAKWEVKASKSWAWT